MIDCDPNSIALASKCYCGFSKSEAEASAIYSLCFWANHLTSPTIGIQWTPQTELVTWTDGGGNQTGDYPTFLANVDAGTLTRLNFTGAAIDTLTGLNTVPTLTHVTVNGNVLINLDVTGCTNLLVLSTSNNVGLVSITGLTTCTNLQQLSCDTCDITGTLNVSGLTNLVTVICSSNFNLTALTLTGCSGLTTADCSNCNITGTLNCSGLTSLMTLNCSNNGSLTTLTLTGCTGLVTLDCNTCDITGTLDVTPCAPSLVTLTVHDNANLTGVTLTGCTSLVTFNGGNCAFAALDFTGLSSLTAFSASNSTGPLTSMDFTNCTSLLSIDVNSISGYGFITSLITSGCSSLQDLFCTGNGLVTLTVGPLVALNALDCSSQTGASLTTLTLAGLPALTNLISTNNSLTACDVSVAPLITLISLKNNQLTVLSVDTILTSLDANGAINGDGDLSSQTPAAPPTNDDNPGSPKNNLEGKGWTMVTD